MSNPTLTAGAVAGIDLSAYLTTDAKRSIAFYRDVIGLTPSNIDAQGRGAEFDLADGQTFGVWDTGHGKTGASVLFGVADIEAAIARVRAAGGEIGPSEDVEGFCAMAFGTDVDGNSYILHQRKGGRTPGADLVAPADAGPTTITGLDLSGYATKDARKAMAFYRDVLGLTPGEIDDEGRGIDFQLPDGTYFGLWNGEGYSGGVMFIVADAKAAVARIRANGAQISDPMESPVCHMAFGKDPDGNDYIIHQRK